MAITFRELKRYISRVARISICFEDGHYDNYTMISDIPDERYDSLYIYGIGVACVEFSRDVYVKPPTEPPRFSSKDDFLGSGIEIAVRKEPTGSLGNENWRIQFMELRNYLAGIGGFSIVLRRDWSRKDYELKKDIPDDYDLFTVYGIGLKDNPESMTSRLEIVLSRNPRPEAADGPASRSIESEIHKGWMELRLRGGKGISEDFLKSMYIRPFWHYCEVCGKKELITAREASGKGWQYPPSRNCRFGYFGPRACGSCRKEDTLFWKVHLQLDGVQRYELDMKDVLTPEEIATWERIKGEPESLIDDSVEYVYVRKEESVCIGDGDCKQYLELRSEKDIDKDLLESMNTRPFWHYCEVCGKKEFITAREAYDKGWRYPPYCNHGFGRFGIFGPRTCGSCQIADTLFYKVRYIALIP